MSTSGAVSSSGIGKASSPSTQHVNTMKKQKREVVRLLLEAHPEGACRADRWHRRPLDEAIDARCSPEIVEMLVKACPLSHNLFRPSGPTRIHPHPIDSTSSRPATSKRVDERDASQVGGVATAVGVYLASGSRSKRTNYGASFKTTALHGVET